MGYIGNTGSGTLTVNGGSDLLSDNGYIGNKTGSTGAVTVSGNRSTWNNSSYLYVGRSGNGTLNITGGGAVNDDYGHIGIYSTGVVAVDGAGSTWTNNSSLDIGYDGGAGTLSITNGGGVSGGDGLIDAGSGSQSTVTVDGRGSIWTTTSLSVGIFGNGAISITNGGNVRSNSDGGSNDLDVGAGTGGNGTVVVDGTGSIWTIIKSNPSYYSTLYIGDNGSGALSITNGGSVNCQGQPCWIGNASDSTGIVKVDGAGSTWAINGALWVGNSGSGTLLITNGGNVSVASAVYTGANNGSTGAINFGVSGGTLTARSVYASPTQFSGTGTINASGLVSDIDLIFDSAHSLKQAITFQQPGQNVTVNLDMTTNPGDLGVGWRDKGSLTIQDGITVNSNGGYLGYQSGSTGVATVTGADSTWDTVDLLIGQYGSGTLSIVDGGGVSVGAVGSAIAVWPGSTGVVAVDGAGSTWNSSGLDVGGGYYYSGGSATLSITGGGTVKAASILAYSGAMIAIDVGRGSSLWVGGSLTNNGTVRILAGAGVPANGVLYSPIAAGSWGGTGTYQAVGGTWSTTGHTFTASSVSSGTSGSAVALDLSSVQRVLVSDNGTGGTGWVVGASFPAATSTTNITFTAMAMPPPTLSTLVSQLPANESVLSGWTFATTNYTVSSTNPVYLSFNVGAGQSSDELDLWQYNGTTWTPYTPTDLTYDGTFASFTATGLSGYAMVVAEPSTLPLLAAGLFGLLAHAWRRRRV
jgi:T5SS/PEP-CTERM-associated repeat protein